MPSLSSLPRLPPATPLSFWRAHCGWDSVTLVLADQIPEAYARSTALSLMHPPSSMDSEVGFLKCLNNNNTIRVRLIDKVTLDWLPNCGGMTQALGKCLVESTSLRREMKIHVTCPMTRIQLVTDTGRVPLLVDVVVPSQKDDDDTSRDEPLSSPYQVTHVWSDMTEFAQYLLDDTKSPTGVAFQEHWLLNGQVQCFTMGYFLVVNGASLAKACADNAAADTAINVWDARPGPHWDKVYNPLCREYLETVLNDKAPPSGALYTMMYDLMDDDDGDDNDDNVDLPRIATRFYRHDAPPTAVRSTALQCNREAQCGTGTIAVVLALWKSGQLLLPPRQQQNAKNDDAAAPPPPHQQELTLTWGSPQTGGDPYPGRTSTVRYTIVPPQDNLNGGNKEETLQSIAFSHSCIELLQEGTCYLPAHDLSAWGL